jgi:hypothetical protein
MEKVEEKKLVENLLARLKSLSDLYRRKVLNSKILGRQLQQMILSPQGRALTSSRLEDDTRARMLLNRLEDPVRWTEETAGSDSERRKSFNERLVKIFRSRKVPDEEMLETLLETSMIPHFSKFTRGEDDSPERSSKKKSRVKILD